MELDHHICDTIKEWQMKFGFREEEKKLYYSRESLIDLLHLPEKAGKKQVLRELEIFGKKMEPQLGKLKFSEEDGRFCITVPPEGCRYIDEEMPEASFLEDFLDVVQTPGATIDQVRGCFAQWSSDYTEEDENEAGLGYVFHLDRDYIDPYYYSVKVVEAEDPEECGLTYHRFSGEDYERMHD